MRTTCAISPASTRPCSQATSSRSFPPFQEVECGGSRATDHRYQEGRVRCRRGEDEAQLFAARSIRAGCAGLFDIYRYPAFSAPVRIELQPLLRDEGASVERHG